MVLRQRRKPVSYKEDSNDIFESGYQAIDFHYILDARAMDESQIRTELSLIQPKMVLNIYKNKKSKCIYDKFIVKVQMESTEEAKYESERLLLYQTKSKFYSNLKRLSNTIKPTNDNDIEMKDQKHSNNDTNPPSNSETNENDNDNSVKSTKKKSNIKSKLFTLYQFLDSFRIYGTKLINNWFKKQLNSEQNIQRIEEIAQYCYYELMKEVDFNDLHSINDVGCIALNPSQFQMEQAMCQLKSIESGVLLYIFEIEDYRAYEMIHFEMCKSNEYNSNFKYIQTSVGYITQSAFHRLIKKEEFEGKSQEFQNERLWKEYYKLQMMISNNKLKNAKDLLEANSQSFWERFTSHIGNNLKLSNYCKHRIFNSMVITDQIFQDIIVSKLKDINYDHLLNQNGHLYHASFDTDVSKLFIGIENVITKIQWGNAENDLIVPTLNMRYYSENQEKDTNYGTFHWSFRLVRQDENDITHGYYDTKQNETENINTNDNNST